MGTIDENDLVIDRLSILTKPSGPPEVVVSLRTLLVDGSTHREFNREVSNLLSVPTKLLGQDFLAAVEADARAALNIPVP